MLETWTTFKKRNKPQIFEVCDGVKWWAKETVQPTMLRLGWNVIVCADYYLDEKPKELAKNIINRSLQNDFVEPYHFVYHFTKGKNGYMDNIQVFYKIRIIK